MTSEKNQILQKFVSTFEFDDGIESGDYNTPGYVTALPPAHYVDRKVSIYLKEKIWVKEVIAPTFENFVLESVKNFELRKKSF